MLCTNRPEGFGPHSTLSSPIPTSCFIDTILIPLPIWLALLFLPILLILSIRHRKANYNPSTAHLRIKPARNCGFIIVTTIYYLLIVANILMEILEIVRLELLKFGIGLIPFTFVGLLLGALLHHTESLKGRVRGWHVVNYILWLGGIAMSVIKVVGLTNEGINGRKGSKYPIADQVTDVSVIAGVYLVIAILEVVLGFWMTKRMKQGHVKRLPGGEEFENLGSL